MTGSASEKSARAAQIMALESRISRSLSLRGDPIQTFIAAGKGRGVKLEELEGSSQLEKPDEL